MSVATSLQRVARRIASPADPSSAQPTPSPEASMAAPALIVTHATGDAPTTDGIFAGLSFFLVQKLPSRSAFVTKIQSNGGRVVKLEAQADHIIADHLKPANCPPGSTSYTFVDKALETGELPEPAEHKAGPPKGSVRPAGTAFPTKATRTPFTAEDDRELCTWVKKHEAKGASVKGNELYKRLEIRNSRHTYQAWRDRYIKKLIDNPPPGVDAEALVNGDEDEDSSDLNGATQRPTQTNNRKNTISSHDGPKVTVDGEEFRQDEVEQLIAQGQDIVNIEPDRIDEAWDAFADTWPQHSAASWRRLWYEIARPEYLKRPGAIDGIEKATQATDIPTTDGAADREMRQMEHSTSPPDRPQSSASLKRKRGTPTPRKQATHGRKRQKDGHDIFGNPSSEVDAASIGLSTDLAPNAAPADAEERSTPDRNPSELGTSNEGIAHVNGVAPNNDRLRELPTSEANKAAAMQLDEDYERIRAESTPHAGQATEANGAAGEHAVESAEGLEMSDLNHLAHNQLLQEADEGERKASTPDHPARGGQQQENLEKGGENDSQSESGSERDTLLHSEAVASQVGDDDPSALLHTHGDALTEANLATQEQQHRDPMVRGVDLPPDDDVEDQTDYVQYLQDLQPKSSTMDQHGPMPRADDNLLSAPAATPGLTAEVNKASWTNHFGAQHQSDLLDDRFDELPMSTAQELDQMMDAAWDWPHSPQTTKTQQPAPQQSQSPSGDFETQVQYPVLPRQRFDNGLYPLHQPKGLQYPVLPHPVGQASTKSHDLLQARFDREVLGLDAEKDSGAEGRDAGKRKAAEGSEHDGNEDDIELEVPEPEGGFGFSSSQPWASQQPGGPAEDRSESSESQQSQLDHRDDVEIDLELPEPEGGFGFSSSPPRNSRTTRPAPSGAGSRQRQPSVIGESDEEPTPVARPVAIELTSSSSSSTSSEDSAPNVADELGLPLDFPQALETQDIYTAETQAPDFRVPSPATSSSSLPHSPVPASSPLRQPAPALADTQPLPDDDVDDYINRLTLAYHYTEPAVIAALKCTSMRPELAELVLLEGKAGKGLPEDVPGIWAEEDDQVIEGGDARGIKRLEGKHGWREVEARLEFLQRWREEGEEDE